MGPLHRAAFRVLCTLGAPVGGVRPRRLYHWLAQRGYGGTPVRASDFRWHRDRWGHRFLLHPFYFIDRQIIAFGSNHLDLLRFLRTLLRPGMICLDVGANLGQFTVHMASLVGPAGRVLAFEPLPHVAERLRGHVAANGVGDVVEIHGVALSNANGSCVFHHGDAQIENQGLASLLDQRHPDLSQQTEVETVRLDDFVERHGIARIDCMKIDIQGAEPLLLEGAARTLTRMGPDLFVEVSPLDLRPLGLTPSDLLGRLEQLGYRMFEIAGGRLGLALRASDVSPDYYATNVYCTKRDPSAN